jgi:hypothetical protein
MPRRPNMRLKRTSSPASHRCEPLTRHPLGTRAVGPWALALTLSVLGCRSSGIAAYCCPAPENQILVLVRQPLTHGVDPRQTIGIQGWVVLRDADGRALFRADTDKTGRLMIPVDYRAVKTGQQLEAHVDLGGGIDIGALVGVRMGQREYQLVVDPLAFLSEEPGISVNPAPGQ